MRHETIGGGWHADRRLQHRFVEGGLWRVADKGDVFAGVVNVGDMGRAYAVSVVDFAPQVTDQFTILRNPNSASLNLAHDFFAVAEFHTVSGRWRPS
ncbi:MAG TPA: hypothetical protein VGM64_15295 [Lacunisphaera sp.]